ncbi:MAG: T9SS type A sorting domain-containing protein [Bacteroidales bacterium]|nr:T9SS type A sorting domain-containing protein [Bacteroidales bacterium]
MNILMKNLIIIICSFVFALPLQAQETYTVTASGFSFTPATIDAFTGDNIVFQVGSAHPVIQVSQTTYNSNGNTALSGGFSFPSGTGTFVPVEAGTYYYVCANHFSSGMKGKINVSFPLSLQKNTNENAYTVYPNPASENIIFRNSKNEVPDIIRIYDITGNEVYKFSGLNASESDDLLDISSLKKGMYIICGEEKGQIFTSKFIKL